MIKDKNIRLTECPRDAMQGIKEFIPTELKIEYINSLLKVGFFSLDFGSFVSAKAMPQMKDTAEVLKNLDLTRTNTKLLVIIGNLRGAEEALSHSEITYIGFPLSVSETFQEKNLNSTIEESLIRIEEIQALINQYSQSHKLLVYLSMGFGNPYGDKWDIDIMTGLTHKLSKLGVKNIALSDTIGISVPKTIEPIYRELTKEFPEIEIACHFHTTADKWLEKLSAADLAGCLKFDGALKGYGGCPLTGYDLVGNMSTENIISFFENKGYDLKIDKAALMKSEMISFKIFH